MGWVGRKVPWLWREGRVTWVGRLEKSNLAGEGRVTWLGSVEVSERCGLGIYLTLMTLNVCTIKLKMNTSGSSFSVVTCSTAPSLSSPRTPVL